MNKIAYIVRGLPGSGKTTTVCQLIRGNDLHRLVSTDNYFIDPVSGTYKFDKSKLHTYHQLAQRDFKTACENGWPTVICDNTNIQHWEMQPYIDIAKVNGYNVVQVLVGDPKDPAHQEECAKRNIHGVPLDTIKRMGNRFER